MRKSCSVAGCFSFCEGHGLCSKHYRRWKRYGDPLCVKVVHGGQRRDHPAEAMVHYGMVTRCYNKNRKDYPDYGGRGIKVCDRWLGPYGTLNFLADMGPRPGKGYSLDRIDNDGDYCPENCRWVTAKEQANNRRRRSTEVMFLVEGRTANFKEAADFFGVKYQTAYTRYRKGLPIKEVFGAGADIIKV